MKKDRILSFDLLRIIAIFSMMMLHVSATQFDSVPVNCASWQIFNIYDSIVRFCVPVLVMISGVFFLDPAREYPMEKLLKKNVWRLVTAYFFWSFAYAVVDAFLTYHRPGRDFLVSVIENTFTGRYHLWFVTMMIALYLLVPVLRKIAEDERLVRYFILLSFLFCYVGNLLRVLPAVGETAGIVLDKMSIVMVGGYTGYFFAGYYFYHFGICEKRKKLLYAAGIVSVLFTMAVTSLLSLKAGAADRTFYNYLFPNNCFAAWAVFVFFKEEVSGKQWKEKEVRWLGKLSELSFGMYLVHDFINVALKKVGLTTLSFPAVLSVPVIAALVFIASFVIILILSKIPFARKYLM